MANNTWIYILIGIVVLLCICSFISGVPGIYYYYNYPTEEIPQGAGTTPPGQVPPSQGQTPPGQLPPSQQTTPEMPQPTTTMETPPPGEVPGEVQPTVPAAG